MSLCPPASRSVAGILLVPGANVFGGHLCTSLLRRRLARSVASLRPRPTASLATPNFRL